MLFLVSTSPKYRTIYFSRRIYILRPKKRKRTWLSRSLRLCVFYIVCVNWCKPKTYFDKLQFFFLFLFFTLRSLLWFFDHISIHFDLQRSDRIHFPKDNRSMLSFDHVMRSLIKSIAIHSIKTTLNGMVPFNLISIDLIVLFSVRCCFKLIGNWWFCFHSS